jgi:AraC-like DNA-binding protein
MSEAIQFPSHEPPPGAAWNGRTAPVPARSPVGAERFGDDEILPPPPAVAEFVLYLWRREFPRSRPLTVQPTLPDGCFDLLTVDDESPYLMGPETVRADHMVPGGTTIVGVRLRPGVGARLFGGVTSRLVDGGAFLQDLGRGPGSARRAVLALGRTSAEHRSLIELLLPRMVAAGPDDGVAFGVEWLARHPSATVDELCARLGWSPREVRRRFTAALGFGPKAMQRMLRFQRALTEARRAGPATTLSRIAAVAGYADQAHMTRDFRALAHTTPGSMLGGPFDPTLDPMLLART